MRYLYKPFLLCSKLLALWIGVNLACLQSSAVLAASSPTVTSTIEQLQLAKTPKAPQIDHWQTSQGTEVYFIRANELPMLDIRLIFAAGSARDGNHPGLASLTNSVIAAGSKAFDKNQLAKAFADLGTEFGNDSYRDMAVFSMRSLTEGNSLEKSMHLLTQILSEPAFRQSAITRIRNQTSAYIQYLQQQPQSRARRLFYKSLYPNSPYGHSALGTEQSIKALNQKLLKAFYQHYYNSNNLTLALVGDLSKDQAKTLAQKIADALPKGEKATKTQVSPAPSQSIQKHIDMPTQQTSIIVGTLGITRDNPDYPALYLANQILGGGSMRSLLMENIRVKKGLTYGVYSGFVPMQAKGPFSISLQTRNDKAEEALELVKNTLAQYIKEGPTKQQLKEAKRNIMGSYPLSLASNAALVGQLGSLGFYDLPTGDIQQFMSQIQRLTKKQVQQTFAKYFTDSQLITITVGPQLGKAPNGKK